MTRPFAALALIGLVLGTGTAPAQAQPESGARLGGGSDLATGAAVRVPQGGSIPPIHYIFADNPESEPIRVEFRADVPNGIEVDPEWPETAIPAGGRVQNAFALTVAPTVAAGEYRVVVQLLRSDIESEPGKVTPIPAVQAEFIVEVTGESATVVVTAISALTGQPVVGTLSLAAISEDDRLFEVARSEDSTLEVKVALGRYRASFLLGDRVLASEDFEIAADEVRQVVLAAETVTFVLAASRPTLEDGRPVVVELVAGINNEIDPVAGPVSVVVRVLHQGVEVDSVILSELAALPSGLTDATAIYRPTGGWLAGTYGFFFELVTPQFTLVGPEVPPLEVPAATAPLDLRATAAAAAVGILVLVLLWWLLGALRARPNRRRKRQRSRHQRGATTDPAAARPSDKPWITDRINHLVASTEPFSSVETPVVPSPEVRPDEPRADRPPTTHHRPSAPPPPEAISQVLIPERRDSGIAAMTRSPSTPTEVVRDMPDNPARLAKALRTIQRISDEGTLATGWSVPDAALVYWAITSSATQETLASTGMTNEELTTLIGRLLRHGLLASAAPADRT